MQGDLLMLNLPTYDNVIQLRDDTFLCSELYLDLHAKDLVRKGTYLAGKPGLGNYKVLIYSTDKSAYFPESGLYLKDNPIPHLIEPIEIQVPTKANPLITYYVWHLYFL
jgi:hypothetical protein